MRKLLLISLILGIGMAWGNVYKASRIDSPVYQPRNIMQENDLDVPQHVGRPVIPPIHASRDLTFSTVLIDSSKNGYGMYSSTTSPLVWVPGIGFLAVYRQWESEAGPSGVIGAAQSADGISWEVAVNLNSLYPGNTPPDAGAPMGRYPSAAGSANSYPTPVWNEYTAGSGGGTNGGRAMYTYDEFGWLGGSYASPVYDLNTGCLTLPCDPPDLWVSQAQMLDNPTTGGVTLLAAFGEGLGPDRYWLLRNDYDLFGYLGMGTPYLLLDKNVGFSNTANYTGSPEFHVNANGIGYMVASGYWNNYDAGGPVTHHTLFYKKTVDYGATWTSTGGLDNTGYSYISDDKLDELMLAAGLLGDSLWSVDDNGDTVYTELTESFTGYDYDVKVDINGGLHILATMVATYPGAGGVYVSMPGAGHYYFFNPTPENPDTWTATLVRDMSVSFYYDYGDGFAGWQYMYPDMAMSDDGQNLWAIASAVHDTINDLYSDIDIFGSSSTDGGVTWTDLGNLTNTPSTITTKYFEMSPHTAPYATAADFYFIFQMHDQSLNTVGGTNFEDFKQWVYIGHVNESDVVGTDGNASVPAGFELNQNYPNPFNPVTTIRYSLAAAGPVSINLYDIGGALVKTLVREEKPAGEYEVTLQAASLPSGVYFYTLNYSGQAVTRKLIVLK